MKFAFRIAVTSALIVFGTQSRADTFPPQQQNIKLCDPAAPNTCVGTSTVGAVQALKVDVIQTVGGGGGGTSSSFTAAFPATGTAAGFYDGTNMQGARVFDVDSGGGTQYVIGVNLRLTANGGSSEAIGQKTMATSLPVVIASDQTAISVTATNAFALDATLIKLTLGQASTTAAQTGPLVQGAVTTGAPTYVTAQTNPLSLTTGGALRVDASAATVTVTGTVTTTPPTDATTNITKFAGNAVATGTGASGVGIPRVTVANDSNILATQSGTWNVGTVTTLTSITNTVTVAGGKTNNNAAPGATNVGSLVAVANAAAQSWTEGDEVLLSTDLAGSLRVAVVGTPTVTANQGGAPWSIVGNKTSNNAAPGATNAGALVGIANAAAPTYVEGNEVLLSTDLAGSLRTTNAKRASVTPTTTNVSCGNAATVMPASNLTNRTSMCVYNNDTVTIFIGGSGVTTANGFPLLPNAVWCDDVGGASYDCIVSSGTANARVVEN